MSAQIDDFEYDVFISYRQNDNKVVSGLQVAEGWVTDFVNNLAIELEATVKGRVNIYFDKNPHHGLGETHNVDESLAIKLRSLILIPIVSQTYCDTESFAWRQEFLPFLRSAASDRFGLNVKLVNGNVASRVLPVRIHEIDDEDVQLLETELKGRLRPVDFIFKSPGVNRPLRSNEEDPLKNTNQTLYRNQLNKTAIAIKDLINGLKAANRAEAKSKPKTLDVAPPKPASHPKSLAVLPFMVDKEEDAFLGDGLAEEVLTALSTVRGIRVAPRAASFRYRQSSSYREMMDQLFVGFAVEGKLSIQNEHLSLGVGIIKLEDGSRVWNQQLEMKNGDLASGVKVLVPSILRFFNLSLGQTESNALGFGKTDSYPAYRSLLRGRYHWHKLGSDLIQSIQHYKEAADRDPQCSYAWSGHAQASLMAGYWNLIPFETGRQQALESALEALNLETTNVEAFHSLAFICMCYEWSWPEIEPVFSRVFSINPMHATARTRYEKALSQIKSFLEEVADSGAMTTAPYYLAAYANLHRGEYEKAYQEAARAVEQDGDSFMAHRAMGLAYLGLENFDKAIESLSEADKLSNRHPWLLFELMGAYTLSGKQEEARAIMDEVMANLGYMPSRLFGYFFQEQ